jgi:hypothetical protein
MYIQWGLNRQVNFQGIQYEVIEVLENDLLLVVPKEDLLNNKFPLTPVVIPDVDVKDRNKILD